MGGEGLPDLLQYYNGGGGGALGTPNLYYVIYGRPLSLVAGSKIVILAKFHLIVDKKLQLIKGAIGIHLNISENLDLSRFFMASGRVRHSKYS